jgi:hypothetical protein
MPTIEQDSKAMLAVPAERDPALRKLAVLIRLARVEAERLDSRAQKRLERIERLRRHLVRISNNKNDAH